MNQALLKLQVLWDKELIMPYADKHSRSLSRPFAYGVTEEYTKADYKIMVIGQEAAGFSLYEDEDAWNLPRTQQWVVDYTRRQLWNIQSGDASKSKYNNSPFWRMIRRFEAAGIIPSWNNVDKVYQKRTDKNNETVIRLSDKQRAVFNQTICTNKTLLLHEIEMSAPDGIIFVTGPYYRFSMETALLLPHNSLRTKRPQKSSPLMDISKEAGLSIPCWWTYHPAYLNRIGVLDACADKITDMLKHS